MAELKRTDPVHPAARARRHCRAGHGGQNNQCAVSRGPQPRAARGGGDAGRPGAGAGGRGDRQDARVDDPHRAHSQPGPGAAGRNPGGDLHQQGGAGDEGPRRPDGRADRRGHALDGDLPLDRREDIAPPCRTGRLEEQLHHPRRRRPDPPHQAAVRGGEAGREALAGARVRRHPRRLEEPRPHARPGAGRRSRHLRQRQGQEALRRLPGAAEDAQRLRLRRPAAGDHPPVPRAPGRAAAVSAALQVHPGGRVPGHQRGAVSVAAAARPIDIAARARSARRRTGTHACGARAKKHLLRRR